MKNKLIKKLKLTTVTCLAIFPIMQEANAACDVGPVLFRDTLFGAGIGLGVGALVLVANQNSNNVPANLATATLIGAGVGAVIGIVELSLSDCSQKHTLKKEKPGFQASPMLTILPENKPELELKNESTSELFQFENINQLAMGVSLSYSF